MPVDMLDLTLLDSGSTSHVVGLARFGHDLATARIPCDIVAGLTTFRQSLDRALLGRGPRPAAAALTTFGRQLFDFSVRDDLRGLYDRLPNTDVRIHIMSNRADLQSLPWEYFTEPSQLCAPRIDRSVVRIIPTIGLGAPPPLRFGPKTHILLASAVPDDQGQVSWPDVKASIELAFRSEIDDERFEVQAIQGTSKASLTRAVADTACDIFHFSGHGKVVKGVSCLMLVDPATGESKPMRPDELAAVLRGRDIRLVVLSACETAAGNFEDTFSVIATALVRSGIPAVVANQFPVFDGTIAAFVGALYRELLRSGDIDRAVGAGRIQLYAALDEVGTKLEWGVPTLYRRLGVAKLFDV